MDTYSVTYGTKNGLTFFVVNANDTVDALALTQEALKKDGLDPSQVITYGCSLLPKERGVVKQINK